MPFAISAESDCEGENPVTEVAPKLFWAAMYIMTVRRKRGGDASSSCELLHEKETRAPKNARTANLSFFILNNIAGALMPQNYRYF